MKTELTELHLDSIFARLIQLYTTHLYNLQVKIFMVAALWLNTYMCICMFPFKTKLKLELVLKFDFHNFTKCWKLVEIEKYDFSITLGIHKNVLYPVTSTYVAIH